MIKDYKFGNAKVGENTLIINMGSATHCPSAERGLCPIAGQCYAARDERIYPTTLPYRDRQEKYWLETSAEQIAYDIEEVYSGFERLQQKRHVKDVKDAKASHRRRPRYKAIKRLLRWNESGDFHGEACVEKLFTVADLTPDVLHYLYTHRTDLVPLMVDHPKNVVIQISVDNPEDSAKYNAMGFNTFFTDTAISIRNRKVIDGLDAHTAATKMLKAKYGAKALVCKWDCSICSLCKVQHGKPIHIVIH